MRKEEPVYEKSSITPGLLETKECVRFQFLKENQKRYNIKKAYRILKISRSGFYDYLHRRKSRRSIENEALAEMILDIFKENEGRYGSRRISAAAACWVTKAILANFPL